MRQTLITGLAAAAALVSVSAAPAMACGGGLFASGCSPCGAAYVAPVPVAPCGGGVVAGGYYGYGVGEFEQLPDPSPQYYYVNQGPTYSGPAMFAPTPYYRPAAVSGWSGYGYRYGHRHYPQYRGWHGHHGGYGVARPGYRFGYGARPFYGPRQFYSAHRPNLRYGAPYHAIPRQSRGYGHPGLHHRY